VRVPRPVPRAGHIPVDGARLYYRTLGQGRPIVVLHGGPDFDQQYLLPELDRLAESFRLVYYDQRGRGRSTGTVAPDDVGIASEVADLESVRRHLAAESVAVLGHSWGGVLAMEYAVRHLDRVSHLILLNSAPGSAEDWSTLREHILRARPAGDVERMRELSESRCYQEGDLETEAEYYRIHFRIALRRPELLDRLARRLRAHFTAESVLTARAIEQRLYDETWRSDGYDLVPKLRALDIPTLVVHGDHDLVPVEVAERLARELPRARLVVLRACGHFAYLEAPDSVHEHVVALLQSG
jgi:proline iminopeptidase